MKFDELLRFVDIEDKRLNEYYDGYPDQEKRILARTVKLNEEVGELCDELLGYLSLQRDDKLDKREEENLAEEFADVILTTLLIAKSAGVDVKKALKEKIDKINGRYEQDRKL